MIQNLALLILVILFGAAIRWLVIGKKKPILLPIPDKWKAILEKKVAFYRHLTAPDRLRFEEDIQRFLNEITVTGVETTVTDEDRLLVASSGVIPLFGYPSWRYRNLSEVLLYEGSFNHDYETREGKERNILGMVGEGSMNRMMILSKPSLHRGFEVHNSDHNVGIHEFVHLLDKADGSTDGIPELFLEQPYIIPWVKLMHQEVRKIRKGGSDINFYGSTNEAEFLSVVSEYFFQQPGKMKKNHPELFEMLEKIYHQDLD